MTSVLLLSMPFGALEWPALGVSLLHAGLTGRGVRCETRYPTFDFADFIGEEEYRWICHEAPYAAFGGDWVFAAALHGADAESDARFADQVLRARWRMSDTDIARVLRARAYADHFVDHCLRSIAWDDYDVVGFTSTFQQNIASLALARRVKQAHPRLRIVFGGANWDGEMGLALHNRFGFVDLVCVGEADRSFLALIEALDAPDPAAAIARVPGVVYRRPDGTSVATLPAPPIRDLDELPIPDFGPYFRDLLASPSGLDVTPVLLLETARGCWWGAKHHCTFCGLNGSMMAFRSKTADRVLAEVRELHRRYDVGTFSVVDNILDMRYFTALLPRLAAEPAPVRFSWEVKANLTREHVRQLAEARIDTIQPGIESLNDVVLDLMDKGTTMLRNVALLKWCRQYGVSPAWNLLFGFPGERPEHYTAQLDVIEAIRFLDPPSGWGPIRLDRFSPYFDRPEVYGIVNVRPMAPYPFLYPGPAGSSGPDGDLMRIASYFDFDYADGRDPWSYAGPVIDAVRRWMDDGPRGGIWLTTGPAGERIVVDDRPGRPRRRAVLHGWKAAAYLACDEARKPAALLRRPDLAGVPAEDLVAFLDGCVRAGLMLADGGAYLSLAIEVAPADSPAAAAVPDTARVPA
jgi:ribosomal peptide maturation radical SAM protein 1